MLELPDVTLCCYEQVAYDLAREAITDVMSKVRFAEVQIYSDLDLCIPDAEWVPIPTASRSELNTSATQYLATQVKTSHWINMQWDSGIKDVEKWDDMFLRYDYIGAPWYWHPKYKVGGNGFALYSTRLWQYVQNHLDLYPDAFSDDKLCRIYRPSLETQGFVWAQEAIAERFSWERGDIRPSFSYHGIYNMPKVLGKAAALKRFALQPNYIVSKLEWPETCIALAS